MSPASGSIDDVKVGRGTLGVQPLSSTDLVSWMTAANVGADEGAWFHASFQRCLSARVFDVDEVLVAWD